MSASHRSPGAGTLERLPSGRWRFKLTGADGKRKASPSFETREEALSVLEAATYELAGANLAPTGAVTLGGYGDAWLAKRTCRSAEDERRLWRSHVAGTWLARMPIAEVKRKHIRDYLLELAQKRKLVAKPGGQRGERVQSDKPLSRQTVKLVFALLHRLLEEAIVDELIETNPARGHRMPRPVTDADLEEKWTFLSAEEIDQLLGCPDISEKARAVFEVAIFTGLRQGEIWGLRWCDLKLDTDRPECVVRHSYQVLPKAAKLRRFPLLPRAAQALRRVRGWSADTSTEALVFPSPDGGMYHEGHDAGWATYSRRAAGIREEVVFHSFRHTCASHLLQGTWGRTWSIVEVRDYLGHCSVGVTERYAHLGAGRLAEAALATCHGVTTGVTAGGEDDRSPSVSDSPGSPFLNSRSRVRTAPRSPTVDGKTGDLAIEPPETIRRTTEALAGAGVLASRLHGNVRFYQFNPRYAFLRELQQPLARALEYMPEALSPRAAGSGETSWPGGARFRAQCPGAAGGEALRTGESPERPLASRGRRSEHGTESVLTSGSIVTMDAEN